MTVTVTPDPVEVEEMSDMDAMMRRLMVVLLVAVVIVVGMMVSRVSAGRTDSGCELIGRHPAPADCTAHAATAMPIVVDGLRPSVLTVHETGRAWGGRPTSGDAIYGVVIAPDGVCWLSRPTDQPSVTDATSSLEHTGLHVALAYDGADTEPTPGQLTSIRTLITRFVAARRNLPGDTVHTCRELSYRVEDARSWVVYSGEPGDVQFPEYSNETEPIMIEHCPRGLTIDDLGGTHRIRSKVQQIQSPGQSGPPRGGPGSPMR